MLQIQPLFDEREEWDALAARESLRYEVLELSVPPALDRSGLAASCHEWYRAGKRVSSLHGAFINVNPACGDTAFRALSQRRCRESCAVAVMLGAKNVVFHSSAAPYLRGAHLDAWADTCAEFYQVLARQHQLNIFIENSIDVDPQPLATLMQHAKDPHIGVCLAVGHAHYSRVPLAQWFDALGERIGYLHLSDNHGLYDEHLPLGSGTVDWAEADALYRQLGKDLPVTLKVGGIDGVKRSLRYLHERGLFVQSEA
ncbi:MAG: sugar phosphate isomerase/epimerase [Oscillospiraceae bacterium]|nr:sugar phosphate isomerase/epimerase [Oscillospiraceae bacterium]